MLAGTATPMLTRIPVGSAATQATSLSSRLRTRRCGCARTTRRTTGGGRPMTSRRPTRAPCWLPLGTLTPSSSPPAARKRSAACSAPTSMKQTTCTCGAWVKWLVCGRPTGSCAVHRQDAGPFAEGEVFGTNIIDFDAPDGWVESVAWSHDGYSLVFSSHDSTLYFATFARDGTSTPTIQVRSPSHVSSQLQSSRASCVVGCAWQWLAPYSRAVPQRQGCGCDGSRHDAAAVQAELGRIVVRVPCAGMFTPHDPFPHGYVACCVPFC